jgi:hypothetical protein
MECVWCPRDVATFGVVVAGCVATEGRSVSLSVAGCVVARDVNAVKEDAWEAVRQDRRRDAHGALPVDGHVPRPHPLLLDILRDDRRRAQAGRLGAPRADEMPVRRERREPKAASREKKSLESIWLLGYWLEGGW